MTCGGGFAKNINAFRVVGVIGEERESMCVVLKRDRMAIERDALFDGEADGDVARSR